MRGRPFWTPPKTNPNTPSGAHSMMNGDGIQLHTPHVPPSPPAGGRTDADGRAREQKRNCDRVAGRKEGRSPSASGAGCLWPPYQRFAEEPICGHLSPSRSLAEFEQLLRWIPRPTSVTPLPGGWRVDSRGPLVSKDYRALVSYFAFFCIH